MSSNEEIVKEAVEEAKAKAAEASAQQEEAETAEEEAKGADPEADAKAEEEQPAEEKTSGKKDKKEKKEKKSKKDPRDQQIEELKDRLMRQMAEFDNYRKRTEKEKSQRYEVGAKDVVEKILPVVDNFERGLASIPEEEKGSPFAEGMEMIYKQLIGELEKMEVKPIPAVGEEFDPNLHNAVMQVESDEYESGVIAQELQKGYTYRGSVVRHSMVAVVP